MPENALISYWIGRRSNRERGLPVSSHYTRLGFYRKAKKSHQKFHLLIEYQHGAVKCDPLTR